MKEPRTGYREVGDLRKLYAERKDAILRRLDDFAAVPAAEYFYELVYCLLTPQSSAVNAAQAVEALRAADLYGSEIEPVTVLQRQSAYIRFHNTKAARLKEVKRIYPEIQAALADGMDARSLRLWLVGNVDGLGWKESSHFLRNIGRRNLAILDRHILKNLRRHRIIRALPTTLTPKRYLAIERRFARFAERIGITMDELDLLFWSRETGEILK